MTNWITIANRTINLDKIYEIELNKNMVVLLRKDGNIFIEFTDNEIAQNTYLVLTEEIGSVDCQEGMLVYQ